MIGQEIHHARVQVFDHLGDLLMFAFQILELQADRLRGAQFGAGDGVVVENLQEKQRVVLVAQAESAQIHLILIAQDQPLGIVPGETDLIFAFADLDDQIDLADAEIVARAVF